MAKIKLDKYYTPVDTANECWEKLDELIGVSDVSKVTDVIEPSVGGGAFCHWKRKPRLGIDIEPQFEDPDVEIVKADYLTYQMDYKEGRLVIGNPPFGEKMKLVRDFYDKSCRIADWVAFVLPISQLNNSSSLYKFDLIYSKDLGILPYSGRELHCCFNVYQRPRAGFNKPERTTFRGLIFYGKERPDYESISDYDFRMAYFGNGPCGKILTDTDLHYCGEMKIKVDDRHPQKKEILEVLNTTDWKSVAKGIAMKHLTRSEICEELKRRGMKEMVDKCALF